MKKLAIVILSIFGFSSLLNAQAQTFNFGGQVNFNNAEEATAFGLSSTVADFTFSVIFDTTQPSLLGDSAGDSQTFDFESVLYTIGDVTYGYTAGGGNVLIDDGVEGVVIDGATSSDSLGITGFEDVAISNTFSILSTSVFFGSDVAIFDALNNASASNFNAGVFNAFGPGSGSFSLIERDPLSGSLIGGGAVDLSNITLTSVGAVSAIPEPATWLMMVFGFAGVGMTLKRRRRVIFDV
jgi:hypothetical protein